jgi:hypothetical protein
MPSTGSPPYRIMVRAKTSRSLGAGHRACVALSKLGLLLRVLDQLDIQAQAL